MENNFQKWITGLQHIGIPANDLEATTAFYEALGFHTAFRTVNEAAGEKVAFLRLGDITIETYENGQAAFSNGALDNGVRSFTIVGPNKEKIEFSQYL